MNEPRDHVEMLTREIRACFNRLRTVGDGLHGAAGLTAAQRAVLETLTEQGRQTVPQIARDKRVSRQHIQTLVNALAEAGLVGTIPNPDDRRSPLIRLTVSGELAYRAIRRREADAFDDLTRALSGCDLEAALTTLAALRAALDLQLQQGEGQ